MNLIGGLGDLLEKRFLTMCLFSFLIIGLSIASVFWIPLEVMPRENVPAFLFVRVSSSVPMDPAYMELRLTAPIEGVLKTVSRLTELRSSTQSQGASFSMTLQPQTNLDLATAEVYEAIQSVDSHGVFNLRDVSVTKLNPEASALIRGTLNLGENFEKSKKLIQDDFRIAIESMPEVSRVDISGLESWQYQIDIPLPKLQTNAIQPSSLQSNSSISQLRESLGSTLSIDKTLFLPVSAQMKMPDFLDIMDRPLNFETTESLSTLGRIRLNDPRVTKILALNGRPSVFFEIFHKEGTNLFALNKRLEDFVAASHLPTSPFQPLGIQFILNKTDDLQLALSDVIRSLLEAMGITFIVVFLFLRDWRMTLLINATIPFTLLVTVFFLYLKGTSLNILTLSGLILGIGMVVDNAILVLGRIEELVKDRPITKAASQAVKDVATALILSAITNVLIFVPIGFIEGTDSFTDLLKSFQFPIIFSLIASLIISLATLPVLRIAWRRRDQSDETSTAGWENKSEKIFRFLAKKKLVVFALVVVCVLLVFDFVKKLSPEDLSSPKDPYVSLMSRFDPHFSHDEKYKLFADLDKTVHKLKSKWAVDFILADFNPDYTTGSWTLYPTKTGEDVELLTASLEEKVKADLKLWHLPPGVTASVGWSGFQGSSGKKIIALSAVGPESIQLEKILSELKGKIESVKNVEKVSLEREQAGSRQLAFVPNFEKLSQYSLKPTALVQAISSQIQEIHLSSLVHQDKVVDAKISILPIAGGWDFDQVMQIPVGFTKKNQVPLGQLGTFDWRFSPRGITRQEGVANQRLYVTLKPGLSDGDSIQVESDVNRIYKAFSWPSGYGIPIDESWKRLQELQSKSNFVLYLSAFLIYMILAMMFDSLFIPIAVMISVPLALLFGAFGLVLVGLQLDVMARLSLVILVGVGVNSSIILIDLIMALRKQGLRRRDAIAKGCSQRLKAVVMTTAIQVISVIPVAIGNAKLMGIPYSSLGIVMISGMFFSTLVTLVILPFTYETLDNVEISLKRWWNRA